MQIEKKIIGPSFFPISVSHIMRHFQLITLETE